MDRSPVKNISPLPVIADSFESPTSTRCVHRGGPGYVYLIAGTKYQPGDLVKIGMTTRLNRRLHEVRRESGRRNIDIAYVWRVADQKSAAIMERTLHSLFVAWRLQRRGDWFRIPLGIARLVGDALIAEDNQRVSFLLDHLEDADLCNYLGDAEGAAANLAVLYAAGAGPIKMPEQQPHRV